MAGRAGPSAKPGQSEMSTSPAFAVALGEQFFSSPKSVERQMAAIVAIPA
ncbi:MAG: hypothetical protein ACRDTX_20130 [Pseudonocardiaceae bacterium]